jgi:chemotaxis protein methyltransferase CheR
MMSGAIAAKEYDFIRKLIYDRSRINLGPDKKELVRSRLYKRLKSLGLDSYKAYCNLLKRQDGDDEMMMLLDVISTNVTEFFREMKHFEFLRDTVLPQYVNSPQGKQFETMRVWCAACSSGEEPYSIAILLADFFRRQSQFPRQLFEIVGTDISTRMLAVARKGIYMKDRVKLPDPTWLHNYFQKGVGSMEGYYRVKSEISSSVKFDRLNLAEWPYPMADRFHVIFCRNVMIYFDAATQEQLVPHLIRRLMPGGYLFIGHSESLLGIEHGLKCVRPSAYQLI